MDLRIRSIRVAIRIVVIRSWFSIDLKIPKSEASSSSLHGLIHKSLPEAQYYRFVKAVRDRQNRFTQTYLSV